MKKVINVPKPTTIRNVNGVNGGVKIIFAKIINYDNYGA